MKRTELSMTIERFLNPKEVGINDLYKSLRVELLHELIFWRDGVSVIDQAMEVDFPILVREKDFLLRLGKMSDELHRILQARLRESKQHLSLRSIKDLEGMVGMREVQYRMWTPHLKDRLQSLIAGKKGESYERQIVGRPSAQLLEMMSPLVTEMVLEGGEDLYVAEIVQQAEIEEAQEIERVPLWTKEDFEIMSRKDLYCFATWSESLFVVPPQYYEVLRRKPMDQKAANLAMEVYSKEVTGYVEPRYVEQVQLPYEGIIRGGSIVRNYVPEIKMDNFYQLSSESAKDQIVLVCRNLAGIIVNRDLNENVPMRIFLMVSRWPTVAQMNQELARIYRFIRLTGHLPLSIDSLAPLHVRYGRGDYEMGVIMSPVLDVRRRSIELLGFQEHIDLYVAHSKRICTKRSYLSCWELTYCLAEEARKLKVPACSPYFGDICSEVAKQICIVTNNPIVGAFCPVAYQMVPVARDITQLVLEARKKTWGPIPIMVFSIESGKMESVIEYDKEFYMAYQGEFQVFVRLNHGLPGVRVGTTEWNTVPMAMLSGTRAAFRLGDPALHLLDPSWKVYRFPPLIKTGFFRDRALWITVSGFDHVGSCRPLIFRGQTDPMRIPEGRSEMVHACVKDKEPYLVFFVKGWSKYSLFAVERLSGKKKVESVSVPFKLVEDLGIVWQSRIGVQY